MKIIRLKPNPGLYCCNIYFALGTWNAMSDVNTVIDVGTDDYAISQIASVSTGVGKKPVERIILTHNHFDHAGGLKHFIKKFKPEVLAFTHIDGVTRTLENGEAVKIGDRDFEVIYAPGHSNDSVCLYCREEGILFSGDTPLDVKTPGGSYSPEFLRVLERIARLNIITVYPGHGDTVTENAMDMIRRTLENVGKSRIVD